MGINERWKKSTKYQFSFSCLANASWTKWLFIKLLTPKSDQHLISPHKISTESNFKENKGNDHKSPWLLNKFSLSVY